MAALLGPEQVSVGDRVLSGRLLAEEVGNPFITS
jgi:hypothetical protein